MQVISTRSTVRLDVWRVEAVITADKELLRTADKVIFPGVGEAETTMNHLKATGMDELIKSLRQPVLGICLGMQPYVPLFGRGRGRLLGYLRCVGEAIRVAKTGR